MPSYLTAWKPSMLSCTTNSSLNWNTMEYEVQPSSGSIPSSTTNQRQSGHQLWIPRIWGSYFKSPQGTVLGPILFLTFINNIQSGITLHICLFADDFILYRSIETPEDNINEEEELTWLSRWANNWQMKFNGTKCHSMHNTTPHCRPKPHTYTMDRQVLGDTTSEKYLGILLHHDMNWSHHINSIALKGHQLLYLGPILQEGQDEVGRSTVGCSEICHEYPTQTFCWTAGKCNWDALWNGVASTWGEKKECSAVNPV